MRQQSLLGPSKTRILGLIVSGGKTAKDIASNLRIQVSAARKHLEDLEGLGIVSQDFRRVGVGRPKKFFDLTEKGRELFPRSYDTLLNAVLAKLVQQEDEAYAESIMGGIAKDLSSTMNGIKSGSKHTRHVVKGLNVLGFQATIQEDANNFHVTSRNCPLFKTASQHQDLVCKGLHETLLSQALGGGHVNRTSWILSGDSRCEHTISKRAAFKKLD
jgi:predicted ArsR family transcriptional regulator